MSLIENCAKKISFIDLEFYLGIAISIKMKIPKVKLRIDMKENQVIIRECEH